MENRQTIIGISPGTNLLGFAVFRRGELVNYGIKSYPGKWSKNKFSHIITSVEKLSEQFLPDALIIKVADVESPSENVELIITGIESLTKKIGLKLFKCALQDIKRACCDGVKSNAKELHKYLMEQHPELSYIEKRGREINRHIYYGKMFEAVGSVNVLDEVI